MSESAENVAVRHVTEFFQRYAMKAKRGTTVDAYDLAQDVWIQWIELCTKSKTDPLQRLHEFYIRDSEAKLLLKRVIQQAVDREIYVRRSRPDRLKKLFERIKRRSHLEDLAGTVEAAIDMEYFFRSLTEQERLVLEMMASGYTVTAIAQQKEIPKQTVSDRAARAREKILEFLKQRTESA
jgi:RNA polymerase sigma factor (sigma-70 family)